MSGLVWGGSTSDDVRHILRADSFVPHGNTHEAFCGERWSFAWMSFSGRMPTMAEVNNPNACRACVRAQAEERGAGLYTCDGNGWTDSAHVPCFNCVCRCTGRLGVLCLPCQVRADPRKAIKV